MRRLLLPALAPKGLSDEQVQAVWVKQANPATLPSLPDPTAGAFAVEANLGGVPVGRRDDAPPGRPRL